MQSLPTFRVLVTRNESPIVDECIQSTAPEHLTDMGAVILAAYRLAGRKFSTKDRVYKARKLFATETPVTFYNPITGRMDSVFYVTTSMERVDYNGNGEIFYNTCNA